MFPLTRPTLFQTPDCYFLSVKMQNKKVKHRPSTQYPYFHKIILCRKNRKIEKKFLQPTDQIFFSILVETQLYFTLYTFLWAWQSTLTFRGVLKSNHNMRKDYLPHVQTTQDKFKVSSLTGCSRSLTKITGCWRIYFNVTNNLDISLELFNLTRICFQKTLRQCFNTIFE